MKAIAHVLATAALAAVLASCGSDEGSGDSSGAVVTDESSTTSTSPDAPADDTVTSVTLRRSGGLKSDPIELSFAIGDDPPPGFTAAEQDKVFAVAQKVVDAGVTLDELPANTCCDRYTYVVVVGTADGSSTTYTALDGEPLPMVFSSLLTQLARV